MEFRTRVKVEKADFGVLPSDQLLLVGSCFADHIGHRFQEERFRTVVNPYGVMYNPVSVLHTIRRLSEEDRLEADVAILTLGTNHVYVLKETGEIVDNCQKRPQRLFQERQLSIEECVEALRMVVDELLQANPHTKIIFTVSPIRYAKYGFHGSQLSKATLLLAVESLLAEMAATSHPSHLYYFPAYELMNDELRDYRFYQPDMLHPSAQAVEYIWENFVEACFSPQAKKYLEEWRPVKEALAHRPFHPESPDYQAFMRKTQQQLESLQKRYPNLQGF